MSRGACRIALESALDAITPALATVWENTPAAASVPAVGTAYQAAFLLAAEPDNPEIGPAYIERGIFQVNLFYPKDAGPKPAEDRAALIRAKFVRGAEFISGGVKVHIPTTPEIGPARIEDDRYFLPVKIRWQARIT